LKNIGISIINDDIPLDEFLRVHEDVIVAEYLTDDKILNSVKNENGNAIKDDKVKTHEMNLISFV